MKCFSFNFAVFTTYHGNISHDHSDHFYTFKADYCDRLWV